MTFVTGLSRRQTPGVRSAEIDNPHSNALRPGEADPQATVVYLPNCQRTSLTPCLPAQRPGANNGTSSTPETVCAADGHSQPLARLGKAFKRPGQRLPKHQCTNAHYTRSVVHFSIIFSVRRRNNCFQSADRMWAIPGKPGRRSRTRRRGR